MIKRKLRFGQGATFLKNCNHHKCVKQFGNICPLCQPNIKVYLVSVLTQLKRFNRQKSLLREFIFENINGEQTFGNGYVPGNNINQFNNERMQFYLIGGGGVDTGGGGEGGGGGGGTSEDTAGPENGTEDITPAEVLQSGTSDGLEDTNVTNSGEEEEEEEGGDGTIIARSDAKHPLFTYLLNDPVACALPYDYLRFNFNKLKTEIESSVAFQKTVDHSLKAWITADSYYVRLEGQNIEELDIVQAYENGQVAVLGLHTYMYHMGMNIGSLSKHRFEILIDDVCKRFIENQHTLAQSEWTYFATDEIRIHFAVVSGKNIRKTRSGGNKFRAKKIYVKKKTILQKFVKYPAGFRGTKSVVNINYTNLVKNKKEKCHMGKDSPCVKFSLKAHMINISPDIPFLTKKNIIEKLSRSEDKHLDNEIKNLLLDTQVSMKDSVTIKNFGVLERMNQFPIILYFIHRKFSDGAVTYSLSCVRAPKRSTLRKYQRPTCHLLMISRNHVAYIPDITSYLGTVFDDSPELRVRRCKYCFTILSDVIKLNQHYMRGECYLSSPIPSHIILPDPGEYIEFIKKIDISPKELICILDIECNMLTPTFHTRRPAPRVDGSTETDFQPLFPSITNKPVVAGNISHVHVPVSIGLCFLDKDHNILSHDVHIDDDIESKFPDIMIKEATKYLDIVRSRRIPTCYMTDEDRASHEAAENCAICEVAFCTIASWGKHADHCHYTLPVFDGSGNVLIGNYRQALCQPCNMRLTEKRDTVTVIAHNMSFYDFPALFKGFVDNTSDLSSIRVIPNGAHGYYRVQYKNLEFIDSLSFIPGSLASLVELKCNNIEIEGVDIAVPLTAKMTRSKYSSEMLPYIGRKQTFPYTLCKSVKGMEAIKEWPSRDAFFNDLSGEPVSDSDYEFGLTVWNSLKKHVGSENMSLLILHEWYLYCDIMLLADIWSWFCKVTKDKFDVYPSNYITGPGMSYGAALKMGRTMLEKLSFADIYEIFESLLRGGYCGVSKRLITANNIDMGSLYNRSQTNSHILILDWSQLYSCLLKDHIPYQNFSYFHPQNPISVDDILNLDPTGPTGYVFVVDIVIPEHLKLLYDDLPLGLILVDKIKTSGYTSDLLEGSNKQHQGRRLVAGHFNLCEYGFHFRLLQFYLQVGCEITKIHDIIQFDQKPVFKPFIEVCVSQREKHRHIPILNKLFKLMGNSLYGRTILNTRKYNTVSTLVRQKTLSRHLNNPRCRKIQLVGKNCFLVTKSKTSVTLEAPIYIGSSILQFAKIRQYRYHYYLAKPSGSDFPREYLDEVIRKFITPEEYEIVLKSRKVIKSVTLAYTDTDSLHYEVVMNVKDISFNELVSEYVFSLHMDRSNFKVLDGNPPNFDTTRDDLYKSEISDNIAVEGVYVSAKCYSLKVITRQPNTSQSKITTPTPATEFCGFKYKKTMKSCPSSLLDRNFSHDYYKRVVTDGIVLAAKPVETNHIKFNELIGRHTTTKLKRRPMTAIDVKRYYENPFKSYGYGHPRSFELGYKVGDIISTKGGYILGTEHLIDIKDVRKFNTVNGDEISMNSVLEIGNDDEDEDIEPDGSDMILGDSGNVSNPSDTLDLAMRLSGINTTGAVVEQPLDILVSLLEGSNAIHVTGEDTSHDVELEDDDEDNYDDDDNDEDKIPNKRRRI